MKLSSKEKALLALLGGVLVSALYYQFVYTNQIEKITTLREEKYDLEIEYNNVVQSITNLETNQEKLDNMTTEINFKSMEFYPTIIQEKLILEINSFLEESTLRGDIGFSEVAVSQVEYITDNSDTKGDSSFKEIVDDYKGNNNHLIENETNETSENNSTATVEMMQVNINFSGQYDALKSFISKVENSNRQIVITDLSTTVGYNGELSGSMSLEFYAIPKISDRDSQYLQWDIEASYGKDIPFFIQNPQVEVISPSDSNSDNNEVNDREESKTDFIAIVKSITSDLPAVVIGKSGDKAQDTYITSNNNMAEGAEIELTKVNDRYYYKYNNSTKLYPNDHSGNGVEFIPKSDRIIIEISSESRVNADDKSGLDLTIVNNTDKIVEVQIKNDDETNPRVSIIGDRDKVTVTRE